MKLPKKQRRRNSATAFYSVNGGPSYSSYRLADVCNQNAARGVIFAAPTSLFLIKKKRGSSNVAARLQYPEKRRRSSARRRARNGRLQEGPFSRSHRCVLTACEPVLNGVRWLLDAAPVTAIVRAGLFIGSPLRGANEWLAYQ